MRSVLSVIAGLVAWAVVATLLNFVLRGGLEGYEVAEHTMHFSLPMMVGYVWQAFPVWYHLFFLVTLAPFVMLGGRLARNTPGAQVAT